MRRTPALGRFLEGHPQTPAKEGFALSGLSHMLYGVSPAPRLIVPTRPLPMVIGTCLPSNRFSKESSYHEVISGLRHLLRPRMVVPSWRLPAVGLEISALSLVRQGVKLQELAEDLIFAAVLDAVDDA